ncbi:hypothetical protein GCM10007036_33850 [Alsobacter metallidurans]|uniref:Uncharacterized protein n=1 Tax=Alsobacter metallidurans TaxID=340221 RepID=A0A917I8H4_9HYPH|nr:hypothetical protein [Alsobacter metallidurans]GGH26222.1 hypothetical protein GCM10007036_33850 [Alsobacter metallidurans]
MQEKSDAHDRLEVELRKLIPMIMAGQDPGEAGARRTDPQANASLSKPEQRDWSNTLDIIERAADWSQALDRRRIECEAQARELMQAINEERLRGENRVRDAEERIRVVEAHAAELEKRLQERERQRESLLSRLAVTNQEALRAEANAQRVERWLDRLHLSIKTWLSAAQDEGRDGVGQRRSA